MEYQQDRDYFELNQQNIVGEGRFGLVLKAYSHKFNTDFALKTIPKGKHTTDKMFYNEVNVLMSFIHPNIVKLYGYFTTLENYNLVLQFCSNGTLRTEVKKYGIFDISKFSFVFRQVLEAIDYSHSKKIAHCDLKPENILIDEYDRIQIADWGQAIAIQSENGIIEKNCGTLSYSSPECINKYHFNAYKNDMYSIGICMYFTVCGQDPWTEKIPIFKKQQIINNEYRSLPSSIDKEISDLIKKLMDLDPSNRPSARELLKLPLFQKYNQESQINCLKTNKKRRFDHFSKKTIKKIPSLRAQDKINL